MQSFMSSSGWQLVLIVWTLILASSSSGLLRLSVLSKQLTWGEPQSLWQKAANKHKAVFEGHHITEWIWLTVFRCLVTTVTACTICTLRFSCVYSSMLPDTTARSAGSMMEHFHLWGRAHTYQLLWPLPKHSLIIMKTSIALQEVWSQHNGELTQSMTAALPTDSFRVVLFRYIFPHVPGFI